MHVASRIPCGNFSSEQSYFSNYFLPFNGLLEYYKILHITLNYKESPFGPLIIQRSYLKRILVNIDLKTFFLDEKKCMQRFLMVICYSKNIRMCSYHFSKLQNIKNSQKGLGLLMRQFCYCSFYGDTNSNQQCKIFSFL